jgi:hypothetical protein
VAELKTVALPEFLLIAKTKQQHAATWLAPSDGPAAQLFSASGGIDEEVRMARGSPKLPWARLIAASVAAVLAYSPARAQSPRVGAVIGNIERQRAAIEAYAKANGYVGAHRRERRARHLD